ncbi:unnamed protein product [Parnassius mnemosyne]|uniref:Uncharacterized protein n=1 Tax=Parnassius mnemosyne TaxID=213953 RepID=A0AAV1L1N9_9NEOP
MTAVSTFGYCLCITFVFTEVASWTTDLEEVRRYFDHQKQHDDYHHHLNGYNDDNYEDYDGMEGQHGRQYAEDYGYETYMEGKVHGIIRKGTKYLEGLKLAMEKYKQTIENCSRIDFTAFDENINTTVVPGLKWNDTSQSLPSNSSWVPGLNTNPALLQILNSSASAIGDLNRNSAEGNSNTTWRSALEAPIRNLTEMETERIKCEKATKETEHVRRLADLALWTTRELQDRAMSGIPYPGHPGHDDEDKELLIRLAWFLDRLAQITGYEPDVSDFVVVPETTTSTTPAPLNPLALPIPEDVKRQMMSCIQRNSSAPATERCAIPVQLPPLLRMVLNLTEDNATVTVNSSTQTVLDASSEVPTDPSTLPDISTIPPPEEPSVQPSNTLEKLWSDENKKLSKFPPSEAVKSIQKRSANDPLLKVMKYYVKDKLFDGSNPKESKTERNKENFYIDNNINKPKSIQKRSNFVKRAILLHIPKETHKDISPYVNHKSGVYYNTDKSLKEQIKTYTTKMRESDTFTIKNNIRKSKKSLKSIQKRSINYKNKITVREPEDPTQDISYYVKNKPGTNIKPSVAGAIEARLGLERIFQTGNIEVVRRYGSNYNPLIPSPFYFGVIKTISDV